MGKTHGENLFCQAFCLVQSLDTAALFHERAVPLQDASVVTHLGIALVARASRHYDSGLNDVPLGPGFGRARWRFRLASGSPLDARQPDGAT